MGQNRGWWLIVNKNIVDKIKNITSDKLVWNGEYWTYSTRTDVIVEFRPFSSFVHVYVYELKTSWLYPNGRHALGEFYLDSKTDKELFSHITNILDEAYNKKLDVDTKKAVILRDKIIEELF